MNITCTNACDAAEYEAFLDGFAADPGAALAYHYPFYLWFLTEVAYPGADLRLLVARDSHGRITGALPGIRLRRGAFDLWLSMAYFGPNAGALVRDGDPSTVRALVAAAREDARAVGCRSMTMYTPLGARVEDYRHALDGVDFEIPRVAQWLKLPEDGAAPVWPRKVRHDIRRAREAGLTVRAAATAGDVDRLWEIYDENCRARGIPVKPLSHVRHLFENSARHGCFLVAEREGRIAGGLVCLFGAGVISYYLPCATPEARRMQAGLLLLDEAVRRGRAAGCRVLNFEASPGTGDDPVFRFKERCGGTPVPYHVLVKLLAPDVVDEYRALAPETIARDVPFAFVAPFDLMGRERLEHDSAR